MPPLMSAASLTRVSRESVLDTRDSFHIHTPFARGQFTDWDMASVRSEMGPLLMGQMHLIQDPAPAHTWGQVLHSPPAFWASRDEGGEKCRAHPRGCSEDRRNITRGSLNRLDMVHKLATDFQPIGKRKNHSINHDGNMDCLEKWGLSYTK